MKYLRLYDLRNETVTIIPYPTKPVDANSDPQDIQSRKKRVRRRMIRRAKRAAFVIAEVATSFASGLIFLYFVSEKLREIRGYDAIGSEYFAAGFIAFFVFLLFERVGECLWTRRQ